jgi:RNA polymerase sigma factor (sigma-70 family)
MASIVDDPAHALDRLLAHAGWARRLAASLSAGAEGEDLVQETWLAALRRPPDPDLPARPWLKTVLRNLLYNRTRDDGRRQAREQAAASTEDPASPEGLAIRFEAHRRLATAVSELPEGQRTVVLLRYYESRSAAEIAELLGVPAGTVRTRLLAARANLRSRLSEGGDGRQWRRVLMPLAPAAARPGRLIVKLAVASALVTALVAIPFVRGRRQGSDPPPRARASSSSTPVTAVARRSPARDLPSFTTSGPRLAAAAMPVALADCQRRNQTQREELARGELAVWRYVGSQGRFERGGSPNPAAEAELRAVLPEALRAGRAESPPFTLECHTWDCRLRVLEKSEGAARGSWVYPFKRGDVLPGRFRKVGFKGGPEYRRDPLSSTGVWEVIANLALADPSGTPVARPGAPVLAVDRSPLPGTLAGCQQQLAELQRRSQEQRELLEQLSNPVVNFDRAQGGRQPKLEREMLGHLEAVFGAAAHRDIDVRCQGGVCRLRGPGVLPSRNGINQHLLGRLEGRERRHEVLDDEVYFELEPASPSVRP